jgi:hypothetical protein
VVFLSACTKIFMYSYGIRNPKVENKKSIIRYLNTNGLDTTSVYAFKDTSALYSFMKSGIGEPEIRFYDRNGYLMLYRDNKKCNGQNDSLISFLDPKNIVKIDSSSNIIKYIDQLRTLDGQVINTNLFNNKDYYLVVYQ